MKDRCYNVCNVSVPCWLLGRRPLPPRASPPIRTCIMCHETPHHTLGTFWPHACMLHNTVTPHPIPRGHLSLPGPAATPISSASAPSIQHPPQPPDPSHRTCPLFVTALNVTDVPLANLRIQVAVRGSYDASESGRFPFILSICVTGKNTRLIGKTQSEQSRTSERSAELAPEHALDPVMAEIADACRTHVLPGPEAKVLVRSHSSQKRSHSVGEVTVD
jgi:hypothetical protein